MKRTGSISRVAPRGQSIFPRYGCEAQPLPQTRLTNAPQVRPDDSAELGIAAAGIRIRELDHRLAGGGDLNSAGEDTVREQFQPLPRLQHRAGQPVADAVAVWLYLPCVRLEGVMRLIGEQVIFRGGQKADRRLRV